MKKFIILLLLGAIIVPAFAQTENPFAGSRWRGRVTYRDSYNQRHTDTYDLALAANGTGIVTISTRLNGQELFQDADGLWSYDEKMFRLECDFPEAEIRRLPSLAWASVYQFDTMRNRFTLLVKPFPDADFTVKTAFVRVDD
jgi:hypothetical protein